MTKYVRRGSNFHVTQDTNLVVTDRLPLGTYTVMQDPDSGEIYLQEASGYKIEGKIYGNAQNHATRILHTFSDRANATGVLLSGEKGCGKTLLAKLLSVRGIEQGIPTLVINSPLFGEGFNKFIEAIQDPCIVIFDEYEKVYRERHWQEALLTVLDGVYPTKKLFILTSNNRYAINIHMLNRPGRIFYCLEYKGLEETFVREYCADKLHNKSHTEDVVRIGNVFDRFNFDMLKALVEEMNRYDEPAHEAMKMMNISPESSRGEFEAVATINGKKYQCETLECDPFNPFSLEVFRTAEELKHRNGRNYRVLPQYCVTAKQGTYTFAWKEGTESWEVILSPVKYHKHSLTQLALVS